MLEMLDAAAGSQRNEPQAHEHHQFPAIYDGPQKPLMLFEGSRDYIESNAVSDILYNVPGKLSWSDLFFWSVFWSSDYGNNDSVEGTQTISSSIIEDENEAIKGKIKDALMRFPSFYIASMLVQFWAPVSGGTQTFLSTSDLPFGLYNFPLKGPCWYRKQCLQYKYIIDDGNGTNYENQFGPPGRVFYSGLPEFNPFVGNYSIKEYPLRDHALQYGAEEYLALPVFESHGKRCVGVLEFLTFFYRVGHDWTSYRNIIVRRIEALGLKSPDISLQEPNEYDADHLALNEIWAGLKEACEAHNLPLAQTWKAGGFEFHDSEVFSIIKKQSYDQREFYSSFVEGCRKSRLREGGGVVGKAFSSLTSCFCKDVTRLSTNQYSLALDAREAKLTSCFAICFRSSYTGYTNYVVEFFLPTSEAACKEPRAFLDSLLVTIKLHFPSFKIASGLRLGEELSVEVIRLPEDDEPDSFKICQTTKSPPRLSCSPNGGENIHELPSLCQQLALGVDAITSGRNTVCPEQSMAALPPDQQFPPNDGDAMRLDPTYQGLSLDVNAVHGGEKNVCVPKQNDIVVTTPLEKEGLVKTSNLGNEITHEDLEQLFGKKLEDAAKSLDVSRSTFKRICRKNKILKWPSCKREVKRALSATTAKKHIAEDSSRDRPHSVLTPDKGNASNAHPIPQSTSMQNESSMTIKARYGEEDMVKFDLSLLSTMMELVDKVAKRFELQAGTFKAKYKDEDDDMIWLNCDEDLRKCLSDMRSLGRPVVHMVIQPK